MFFKGFDKTKKLKTDKDIFIEHLVWITQKFDA